MLGISTLFTAYPQCSYYAAWDGAIFVTRYGVRAFWAAFHPDRLIAHQPAFVLGTAEFYLAALWFARRLRLADTG